MEKKTNILPSVQNAKLVLKLYNSLKEYLAALDRPDRLEVLSSLQRYANMLETDQQMPLHLRLKYFVCCEAVFEFLYKTKQVRLSHVGFDRKVSRQLQDILITIANDYDEN